MENKSLQGNCKQAVFNRLPHNLRKEDADEKEST